MSSPLRDSASMAGVRPLILLDRDGVINEEREDFVKSVDEWRPIPGSLEAIARLCRAGWDVFVVSNQSGLARGLLDETALASIHDAMERAVAAHGGRIAGIFYCPHHPDDGCACRKPAPGLVHAVERAAGRSARGAPFVGDRLSDVGAARSAGCRPILVSTGMRRDALPADPILEGVPVHDDLCAAVEALLGGAGA